MTHAELYDNSNPMSMAVREWWNANRDRLSAGSPYIWVAQAFEAGAAFGRSQALNQEDVTK